MNDEIKDLKDGEEETEAAPEKNSSWIIAAVLILVGFVLLLSNFTSFEFENWWALFMFIPAGFMFSTVWRDYKDNDGLTNKSTGTLIGGLAILFMIAVFLFNLSWGSLWPVAFIFGGIAVLLGSRK
ncbi:MAG: hypothetical protein GY796_07870 [Chloroflexi bacterium]|nr:hypothetical protein [Chloroflexota bacterium]